MLVFLPHNLLTINITLLKRYQHRDIYINKKNPCSESQKSFLFENLNAKILVKYKYSMNALFIEIFYKK